MPNLMTRLVEASLPGRYIDGVRSSRQNPELTRLRQNADATDWENQRIKESMRELSLYLEDLGWTKLGDGWEADESGLSLKALKENNEVLQSLLTINPTIKKAINARVGYIWGRGVTIKANQSLTNRVVTTARNQTILFSEHAYWQLEATLATDGNLWAQRNKNSNEITLVPLHHMAGWVTDPDDPSRVNYWLVSYTRNTQNFATGEVTQEEVKYFVPAHDAMPTTTRQIDGIKVNRQLEMVHVAANRQRGWILGVPDLIAAMFWAKAHKELFEAGVTYTKAQGKFAAKVVGKTDVGGASAAATLRDEPRRNENGEVLIGGTAVATGGLDYQLMGKMSGGVDFSAFDPVGALIAAGLGIPLHVLTATSVADVESLEQSTVNEMQMRQKLWSWFYIALFGGKAEVVWPKIKTEPEYRRIQSVEISNKTNVMHRAELRQLTLEAYGMDGDPNDLPDIEEQPDVAINAAKIDDQPDTTSTIVAAQQGVSTGIGKLSDGPDSKAARDNTLDNNVAGQ